MVVAPLVMGSGMMPSFDWGSMWLIMVIPSIIVGTVIVLVVFLFLHNERPGSSRVVAPQTPSTLIGGSQQSPQSSQGQSGNSVLGDVYRALSPTLMDDEKRVMGELAGAGGEVLQSDLPRMTNFSKATVSKAIHNLEVRGIIVREKHKWTYWCKINPRLVDRVSRGKIAASAKRELGPESQSA